MMDSPARNPSPPPELREHAELLDAERIGNTAFSKHWLFTTLMKLIEVKIMRCHEKSLWGF